MKGVVIPVCSIRNPIILNGSPCLGTACPTAPGAARGIMPVQLRAVFRTTRSAEIIQLLHLHVKNRAYD